MNFGGFLITYQRPEILVSTIHAIFAQTLPPQKLWIIDNSEDRETEQIIFGQNDSRLTYVRMGKNAGPAGAAAKGLEICGKAGLDWIYWGDDNDPPYSRDSFERLLKIRNENAFCGVLGAVGHFFDRKKGVIKRVQTKLLKKKEWIEVDYVAGGMCMLVSGDVARAGIAPDRKLFFGFEELDFCLKAKRRGFSILVDCGLFLEARELHSRTEYERPNYQKKKNLVREYYSLRNLLMISDSLTLNAMKKRLILKWMGKSIYGFRYGPAYGFRNFRMISLAFWHYWRGKLGKTLELYSNFKK
ncbi:MAG: glycosyl transferase [Cyclobacterium sp.]|nr:glycosyl transferase [Cyclobacterium sp.]